uniref:Uncharacterized protein n=1 Tax=Pundamilia nyererei TaxID=303518 RepID=A0A3B4FQR0_9CICH
MDENTLTPLQPWSYFFPGSDFAKWNNRVVSNLATVDDITSESGMCAAKCNLHISLRVIRPSQSHVCECVCVCKCAHVPACVNVHTQDTCEVRQFSGILLG